MRKMWLSCRIYFGDFKKILELGNVDFGDYYVRSNGQLRNILLRGMSYNCLPNYGMCL